MAALALLVRLSLAAALAFAAITKLADLGGSVERVGQYGFRSTPARIAALVFLIAAELGLAGAVAAGSALGAWAAAGLMLLFAAALVAEMLRGRYGAPCNCFGSHSTISGTAIARNLLLMAGFLALPLLGAV